MTKPQFITFTLQKLFTSYGYYSNWMQLYNALVYAKNIDSFKHRKESFNDIAQQAPMKDNVLTRCLRYEDIPEFIEEDYKNLHSFINK